MYEYILVLNRMTEDKYYKFYTWETNCIMIILWFWYNWYLWYLTDVTMHVVYWFTVYILIIHFILRTSHVFVARKDTLMPSVSDDYLYQGYSTIENGPTNLAVALCKLVPVF